MVTTRQTNPCTAGELLFQNYLDVVRYPYEFEKEFPGRSARPDYTVKKDGVFLFDVKDFDPYMPLGGGSYDPYPRIREKIDAGRKKFQEFRDFPCSIVLRNNGNIFVHLESRDIMLGSMYGDSGFTFPVGPNVTVANGPLRHAFLGRGKMVHPDSVQNTTISSLITLRYVAVGRELYRMMIRERPNLSIEETLEATAERFPDFDLEEKQLGVIVWENAVARMPLPRHLFTGPYDERWGVEGDSQQIVFRGNKLAELKQGDQSG
jgi:hypothetical protein